MTKWREIFISNANEVCASESFQRMYWMTKRKMKQNVVIREMQKEESNNALFFDGNIIKFFENDFTMRNIMVCGAHTVGQGG